MYEQQPQSVPVNYERTYDDEPQKDQTHYIREALEPQYVQETVGARKIIQREYEKEVVIWNEKIQFVDKYVDVPYEVEEIEYYTDSEGDIIENVPCSDKNTEIIYKHDVIYDVDKVVTYDELREV